MRGMFVLLNEMYRDADSEELVELDSCDKTSVYAKVQRMRGDIVEIVRKVFAIDGMSLVFTIVYTDVL